jgi:dipeptidyl aminopeptidase/acylaminoacyl peptidase
MRDTRGQGAKGPRGRIRGWRLVAALSIAALSGFFPAEAQDTTGRGRGRGAGAGAAGSGGVILDSARVRQLYVSRDPRDLPGCTDCGAATKRRNDSIWLANAPGKYDYRKTTYKSAIDGLDIPVYVYAPLDRSRRYPTLVWVHGGVHGDWTTGLFPWVVEAVQRGYVIVAPDYRGSTGYTEEFYKKIDYGGWEVDDVYSSYDFIKTLPFADTTRVGLMGWSHGGFIVSHILFRGKTPFKSGVAMVPVTNLIFRLSDHAPSYARNFAAMPRVQGLPHDRNCGEKRDRDCIDIYIERSPVYHVEKLQVPLLVHVATNDCDVFFRENQQMVYTLMALKPNLAETKIYKDPPPGAGGCGHTFNRRVRGLEKDDTPEQVDSWNLVWRFFERTVR